MRDNKFWKKVGKILKVFEPLVKVFQLVDGDDKSTMGFIYEAMNWAKKAIMENVRYHKAMNWAKKAIMENVRYHKEYIKIIDA